jgi:hypothetical protein
MTIIYHPKYPEVIGVRAVEPRAGVTVHVTFTDGSARDIDLEPYLCGPIFEPIRNDSQVFATVFVDPIGQTLAWPNGADIAPETLYYDGSPPWSNDVIRSAEFKVRGAKPRSPAKARTARRYAARRRTQARVPAVG